MSSPRKPKKAKKVVLKLVTTTSEEYLHKKAKLQEVRSLISVGTFQFKYMFPKEKDVEKLMAPLYDEAYRLEGELISIEDSSD